MKAPIIVLDELRLTFFAPPSVLLDYDDPSAKVIDRFKCSNQELKRLMRYEVARAEKFAQSMRSLLDALEDEAVLALVPGARGTRSDQEA